MERLLFRDNRFLIIPACRPLAGASSRTDQNPAVSEDAKRRETRHLAPGRESFQFLTFIMEFQRSGSIRQAVSFANLSPILRRVELWRREQHLLGIS